jgi:membrane protease YdiL (CAAX protease family)
MELEHAFPPPAASTVEPAPPRPDRTPWGLFDMAKAIGIVVLGLIVIGLPAFFIAVAIAGDADAVEDDNAAMAVLEGASALLQVVLLGAVVWFTVRKYGVGWSALGLRTPERGGWWAGVILFFAAIVAFLTYAGILSLAGVDTEGNVSDPGGNLPRILIIGLLAVVLAPFIEEVFFRGFVFGGLRGRWGVPAAAVASALLWSVAHFQDSSSLPLIPGIALIGLLFAGAYYYTGSLLAPITAHLAFNALSFVWSVLLEATS